MNILFYHSDETCPTCGGIQRTTAKIAEGLTKEFGYKCYNVYDYPQRYPMDIPRYNYIESRQLSPKFSAKELSAIINEWGIDIIINQQVISKHKVIAAAIAGASHKCQLIYCHHNTPQRLFNLSFNHRLLEFKQASSIKSKIKELIKLILFPVYSRRKNTWTLKKNASDYREIYKIASRFVLLSHEFDKEWKDLTGISDITKLTAIPNMLSFQYSLSEERIKEKEKKVLLVARLIEFPKNITSALRIWERISKNQDLSDWSFDIIGHGRDEQYLKDLVLKYKIPRVNFLGHQESEKYYEKSAIFMMTSIREGWPMTLMESLQKGCVPIAYDSFASVHDIIENGKNGYLIDAFNEKEFANKLEYLISNDNERIEMAKNGISSSSRFSYSKVISLWNNLLLDVMKEKRK